MNITRGKIKTALKIVVYGQEGVGKSTFASQFPNAVFIDTEGSTKQLGVARFDAPTSWEMLLQEVEYVKRSPSQFGTLVIDTADWAEKLCIKAVCDRAQKKGVEDFGWGKGYVYVMEEFARLINLLTEVVDRGVHVVVTAHAQMNKVEQPDEMGSYDRWELKLSKKCSPLLKEWADILLFANYKTIVVNTGEKKYKGQGGQQRIMYTSHTAAWDAKNRFGLPESIPLDFAQIAPLLMNNNNNAVSAPADMPSPTTPPQKAEAILTPSPAPPQTQTPATTPQTEKSDPLFDFIDDCKEKGIPVEKMRDNTIPDYVPKALADLMRSKSVSLQDIENIVSKRGYFPPGTPFRNYPADFVDGCLIAAFPQLYDYAVSEGLVDLPF